MNVFDKTITIQASPNYVWEEALRFARKGRIKVRKENSLLVSKGTLMIGYVYFLEEQPGGSTLLRHVIGRPSAIEKAIESTRPLADALDEIAAHKDTVSETIVGIFMDLLQFPPPENLGERHMSSIKSKAEDATGK